MKLNKWRKSYYARMTGSKLEMKYIHMSITTEVTQSKTSTKLFNSLVSEWEKKFLKWENRILENSSLEIKTGKIDFYVLLCCSWNNRLNITIACLIGWYNKFLWPKLVRNCTLFFLLFISQIERCVSANKIIIQKNTQNIEFFFKYLRIISN